MAYGSSLQGLYDSSVIESIVQSQVIPPEEIKAPDYEKFKEYKFKAGENTVLFSSVFWKPKEIPDIPIPMFAVEDWHEEAQLHIPDIDNNWIWNKPVTERFALALYCGDTTLPMSGRWKYPFDPAEWYYRTLPASQPLLIWQRCDLPWHG